MENCDICSYYHKGKTYYIDCSCAETKRKQKENDTNTNKKGYTNICGEWVKMQLIN